MKCFFLPIFFSILLCGQVFAGNIISEGASDAEVVAQTEKNAWLNPANLPALINDMLDTTAVNADYFLFYDATTGKLAKCDGAEILGGSGASDGNVTGPSVHLADYAPLWGDVNSTNLVEGYPITAAGKALVDDASAAAQRTTLGLGTAATHAMDQDAETSDNVTFGKVTATNGFVSGSKPLPGIEMDVNSTVQEARDAWIHAQATDSTNGTEDVDIYGKALNNGVETIRMHLDSDGYSNFPSADLNIDTGKKYRINGTQIGLPDLASKSITGLTATNWRVFYSAGGAIPVELALGADGTYLRSNGAAAAPTFTTPSGAGDVTKVGTPSNYQWGIWTGDGTLKGLGVTASRAVVTDANGQPVAATTTATEIGHVNGVTGALQGQIDTKGAHAGQAWTGSQNFGGADLELPQGQTPDTDGDVDLDFTDGSLVVQHGSAHAELGAATDVVMGKLIKSFTATLAQPDLLQAEIDNWPLKPIEASEFPHGIVITDIYLKTSASSTYAINVENWDDPTTINVSNGTIDAITTSSSTEAHEDTITYATIAAGQIIMLDLPTDNISWVEIQVEYYEVIS